MVKIAVIGGGAASSCVIESLAKNLAPAAAVDITVFDAGPNLWSGSVFQPDVPEALANVGVEDMSLRSWDIHHGARWLRARGHDRYVSTVNTNAFPPRALVGEYFKDTVRRTIADLREYGSTVTVQAQRVTAMHRVGGMWTLQTDAGTRESFDFAVLALGGAGAYDPYGLAGSPGYVGTPYPMHSSLAEVPQDAHVGIIGTGLTAIDVVMGLRGQGHRGRISLMSRRGLLPSVRRAPCSYEPVHFTAENVERLAAAGGGLSLGDVLELVRRELAAAGADLSAMADELADDSSPIDRLRYDLAQVNKPDIGWQVLQKVVTTAAQTAWFLLRDRDKHHVKFSFHHLVMRLCCPMPPENGARLLELLESGRLDVRSGLRGIDVLREGGHRAVFSDGVLDVDYTVDAATPAVHKIAPPARSLVDSLILNGCAVPHPHGGLRLDRHTSRVVNAHAVADARLYAVGDITHGAFLFTFGIPVIADRSTQIATAIRDFVLEGSMARSGGVPVVA
ncbi:FAD/NAD(P)-binding protein [Lentzea sp. NPDC051213]|uniref:FAD/NAD(P)-binding protein n=1 Tax=Lentzea sp. NPDC051213 TaxID=3364126 RepID=UPI00379E5BE1